MKMRIGLLVLLGILYYGYVRHTGEGAMARFDSLKYTYTHLEEVTSQQLANSQP